MSPQASNERARNAVIDHVETGAYPDQDVASAELPPAILPELLESLQTAQEEVKNEIRSLSSKVAPDIDGWIAQAKQLQADIEQSRATAHEIVKEAEAAQALQATVTDARSKSHLLEKELEFNETLRQTLEQIQGVTEVLDNAQDAAVRSQYVNGLENVQHAEDAIARLGAFDDTRPVGLLRGRASQVRAGIVDDVKEVWNSLVVVDGSERKLTVKSETSKEPFISLQSAVEALERSNLLDPATSRLCRDIDIYILSPRLTTTAANSALTLHVDGDHIGVTAAGAESTISKAMEDLDTLVDFLNERFPRTVLKLLFTKLVPKITSRLTTDWLEPQIPMKLDGLEAFHENLSYVLGLANHLEEVGAEGGNALGEWVDQAPRIWLARRKEVGLAEVRNLCLSGIKERKTVERIETQTVSKNDVMVTGTEGDTNDDWGSAWDDEADAEPAHAPAIDTASGEEDMSAWDDEDVQEEPKPAALVNGNGVEADVDEDAWGWQDDEGSAEPRSASSAHATTPGRQHKTNGTSKQPQSAERELTLKENYTVTVIPDKLLDYVMQNVADVEILRQPSYQNIMIAQAATGLYTVPTLLLAMYRATAATCYEKDVAGNMLMYNDCTRLAERLRAYLAELTHDEQHSDLPASQRASSRLRLDADLKGLDAFGRRAYGREMEAQRTIVRDLLDGAQGFTNCAAPPYSMECDEAVSITIDRIKDVNKLWSAILSRSALLQSLGSLVSTVISKMISDIEDMSDISEEESKKLKHFCDKFAELGELFEQQQPDGSHASMIGYYTPNWFKFQYLAEILESSLADIKYLWTDSELKLEFEIEEVCDLIKALFAESDYRRKAILDIRSK